MSTSPFASSIGPWLMSWFLITLLYGMGLLQTWLYFHWYSKDHWWLKTLVIVLLLMESLQLGTFSADTYITVINHFGDIPYLTVLTWMHCTQLIAGYFSAVLVQMYFSYVIYVLNGKKLWPFTVPIVITALLDIAAGLALTVKISTTGISLGIVEFTALAQTKVLFDLQITSTLVCDILITAALYITLRKKRTNIQDSNGRVYRMVTSTDTMLQMLMVHAVNRGVLTVITSALSLILFVKFPGTLYFYLGLLPNSKLYMNSMLATLNSRQYVSKVSRGPNGWNSIRLPNSSDQRAVDEIELSNSDTSTTRKANFAADMI
ncbi:hypothetical protein J3R30DRAFT_1226481 [Lentinula aciculospora]|uniref:DUF6534 domain-containing protein n=1 Tax=Lentinula aciculospora TaxID=153920 RepID=A0A9W8ZYE7_9AGAR|nr:hypothetical protein J3R30DRAFT_1226481 [Lentinula aciculospora]